MARPKSVFSEFVDLLVRQPSPRELLEYRPSDDLQALASELLVKQNAGQLTAEELRVLDEIEQFEVFMRLLKARLRAREVITA